jgi:hypothetical protein
VAIQPNCPVAERQRECCLHCHSADTDARQLFFAAYGKKIHITIPQGLKQLLPDPPDLILDLPVSQDAKRIGGFIDLSIPHCVNNMLVGDLGSHEILLVACDDGDVIAFYVHTIMSCIKAESAADTVKP